MLFEIWSCCHFLIRLGDFEKSLLRACMSCTQRQCVMLSWCLSVIGSDSMTIYLSSMMTRKPCKVYASLTENTMMVKYRKERLSGEGIMWTDGCGQKNWKMYEYVLISEQRWGHWFEFKQSLWVYYIISLFLSLLAWVLSYRRHPKTNMTPLGRIIPRWCQGTGEV